MAQALPVDLHNARKGTQFFDSRFIVHSLPFAATSVVAKFNSR